MTASRWRQDDGLPDRLVVEQLLLGSSGRIVVVRPDVRRLVVEPGAQLVDRARGGRDTRSASVVEAGERGLDGGQAGVRLLATRPAVRPTTPSRRMSHGRVRPWPTSVATMTQKVR